MTEEGPTANHSASTLTLVLGPSPSTAMLMGNRGSTVTGKTLLMYPRQRVEKMQSKIYPALPMAVKG